MGNKELGQTETGLPLWKRALDLSAMVLLLPVACVLGCVVALIIKLGSRGPVFFKQERVGYKGSLFTCYKFRTMKVNAETEVHRQHIHQLIKSQSPMVKLDERKDPRLIPMGSLLRSLGLDELPQLWNVLRGEMSLVGPRPCLLYEYELYEPQHRQRLAAVPGLTGLWQVSGKNQTSFEEMVELDITYARRLSLGLDLLILLKTAPALWKQFRELRAAKRREELSGVDKLSKSIQ